MTSFSPLVSVVITNYNRRELLENAIGSVASQTLEDWELIVVDDHSEDDSVVAIKRWMNSDHRIRAIFHARNEGIAKSRNDGIQMSTGKYVAILDSDDMFRKDALQRMTSVLEKSTDYGAVVVESTVIDEKGEQTGKTSSGLYGGKPKLQAGNFFDELINQSFAVRGAFRRKLIAKHGVRFDEDLKAADDWLFWMDLSAVCNFVYIAEPLHYCRVYSGNLSRSTEGQARYIHDFAIIPEKVFSRHDRLLDVKQKRIVLAQAAYWCEQSSSGPTKARGAMYRSIIKDLDQLSGRSESELNEIKASFMFRCMKFLATKIDGFFPDGTRRGEVKRNVTNALKKKN